MAPVLESHSSNDAASLPVPAYRCPSNSNALATPAHLLGVRASSNLTFPPAIFVGFVLHFGLRDRQSEDFTPKMEGHARCAVIKFLVYVMHSL